MPNRTNRILTIVFAALLALNVGYLLVGFASIPNYYARVASLTIPPYEVALENYPTNEMVQERAAAHNMTLPQYALSQVVFHSAVVLLCMAVALLIVLRAGWNWFAWYSAFFLVFIAEYAFYDEVFVARLLPLWIYEIGALFWPLILLYLFLFPNGKSVPRRAIWVILPFVLAHFALQGIGFGSLILPSAELQTIGESALELFEVVVGVLVFFILGCQVYRYLRVSTREEKQQTKWFLFGLGFFIVLSTVSDELGSSNPYAAEINLLIFAFVPLSIGIAILRYRLWDIDVIIRRTVTYALVTALLLIVFFGSVILLQLVFANIFPDLAESEVVTVISTLAIAALFVPLRNRIQNAIDKRFNRKKYDAQQVLQKFGETVRDETDLEKLTSELVNVVNETMQPKSVSLWLKKEGK